MFSDLPYHLEIMSATGHYQLDLCDYSCGKDIYDNAWSNMWNIFRITQHLHKSTKIVWFPVKNIEIFNISYKIQNLN